MWLEAVFDAPAEQPAGIGAGPTPNSARKVQQSRASHPTAADLAKYKPAVIHDANAARYCTRVRTH